MLWRRAFPFPEWKSAGGVLEVHGTLNKLLALRSVLAPLRNSSQISQE